MLSQYRMLLAGGRTLRVLADVVMVNAAWAAALLIRYVWEISSTGIEAAPVVLQGYATDYLLSCGPLTFISLVVFYVLGFYTRGRYYQGRYKALVVAQGVTVSYLLLGFLLADERVGERRLARVGAADERREPALVLCHEFLASS